MKTIEEQKSGSLPTSDGTIQTKEEILPPSLEEKEEDRKAI